MNWPHCAQLTVTVLRATEVRVVTGRRHRGQYAAPEQVGTTVPRDLVPDGFGGRAAPMAVQTSQKSP